MTKRSDFQLPVRTSIDADARVIAWDPTDPNGEPFVVPAGLLGSGAVQVAFAPINVKDYGAVGDGVTNDTAAIAAAVAALAARPGRGALYLPAGAYNVTSWPNMPDRSYIVGDGQDATRIRQVGWGATGSTLISWVGTLGAATLASLTVNLGVNNRVATVDSTSSLVVGAYYLLQSTTSFSSADPLMKKGEYVRVQSIDSATSVTFEARTRDLYTTTDTARLTAVTFVSDVGMRGLTIENTDPGNRQTGLAIFFACKDVSVLDVGFVGCDTYGLNLSGVLGFNVDMVAENGRNDTPSGYTGYGILVSRASADGFVKIRGTNLRHAFTCDSVDNASGVPRHIVVTGVADDCSSAAFDTHATGQDILFSNCIVTQSTVAFQLRSKSSAIMSCKSFMCNDAVYVQGDADGCSITGSEFRAAKADSQGRGVKVDGSPDRLIIANNTFDNIQGYAIEVNSNARRMKIMGNLISHIGGDVSRRTGIFFDPGITDGIGHVITGNTFVGTESATSGEISVSVQVMQYAVDLGGCTLATVTGNFATGLGVDFCQNIGTNDVSGNTFSIGAGLILTALPRRRVDLEVLAPSVSRVGFAASSAFLAAGWFSASVLSSGAVDDEIVFVENLNAGTHTLATYHDRGTDRGIYTVALADVINGVIGTYADAGTFDGYAAAAGRLQSNTAGIVISRGGLKAVRYRMATKNAASSSFFGSLSKATFVRTA